MPGAWVANLGTVAGAGGTGGTSIALTFTAAVSAGNTVIIGVGSDGALSPTISTISDTRGNTWTVDEQLLQGTAVMNGLISSRITTAIQVNDIVTINLTGGSVQARMAIAQAFSGIWAPAVAASSGTGTAASGTTATATGGASEPQADTLSVVSAAIGSGVSAVTVGSGFSNFQTVATTGTIRNLALESRVDATANSTRSGTVTWTTSKAWAATIGVYRAVEPFGKVMLSQAVARAAFN